MFAQPSGHLKKKSKTYQRCMLEVQIKWS